jgi:hypothetical protein
MALANMAARFILELVGVGALGYWGFQAVGPLPARLALAVGAALAFIALWAVVVAPNATNALGPSVRILIGSGLLLVAAGAVALADRPVAAAAFAVAIVVNTVRLFAFDEESARILGTLGRRAS